MSELKEIGIRWEENGELHFSHVYLKSEADKVIAEKDDEITALKIKLKVQTSDVEAARKLNTSYLLDYAEALKRESHHKYKRCLAMARWCESEAYIHEHGSDYDEDLVAWFGKWYKRWLKLAEKFKEGK